MPGFLTHTASETFGSRNDVKVSTWLLKTAWYLAVVPTPNGAGAGWQSKQNPWYHAWRYSS